MVAPARRGRLFLMLPGLLKYGYTKRILVPVPAPRPYRSQVLHDLRYLAGVMPIHLRNCLIK